MWGNGAHCKPSSPGSGQSAGSHPGRSAGVETGPSREISSWNLNSYGVGRVSVCPGNPNFHHHRWQYGFAGCFFVCVGVFFVCFPPPFFVSNGCTLFPSMKVAVWSKCTMYPNSIANTDTIIDHIFVSNGCTLFPSMTVAVWGRYDKHPSSIIHTNNTLTHYLCF